MCPPGRVSLLISSAALLYRCGARRPGPAVRAPVSHVYGAQNRESTKFILKPLVEISRTGDYEKDLLENTQRFTKVVEEVVREYPDQWFWITSAGRRKVSVGWDRSGDCASGYHKTATAKTKKITIWARHYGFWRLSCPTVD